MTEPAEKDAGRTTCLVAVWDDGIYRTRCSMGTKGRCAKHGPHQPHPNDGRPCEPNPHDGYCHTHGVYMDPNGNMVKREPGVSNWNVPNPVRRATTTPPPNLKDAGHDIRCEREYTDNGVIFIDCLCGLRKAKADAWDEGWNARRMWTREGYATSTRPENPHRVLPPGVGA